VKITLLLCDSAQAVGGKLYILGGGWNIISPPPGPTAVVLHVHLGLYGAWDFGGDATFRGASSIGAPRNGHVAAAIEHIFSDGTAEDPSVSAVAGDRLSGANVDIGSGRHHIDGGERGCREQH